MKVRKQDSLLGYVLIGVAILISVGSAIFLMITSHHEETSMRNQVWEKEIAAQIKDDLGKPYPKKKVYTDEKGIKRLGK